MFYHRNISLTFTALIFFFFLYSCKNNHAANKEEIVEKPEQMDKHVSDNIKDVLQYAYDNEGKINDQIKLHATSFVDSFYQQKNYANVWSKDAVWNNMADSLYNFISNSEDYGLFPADFHLDDLKNLKNKLETDSLAKTDANLWTQADITLTDAFMQLTKHLKWGRLLPDSISLISYSAFKNDFFTKNLNKVLEKKNLTSILNSLEPRTEGYIQIKKGIKHFVDSMDRQAYSYLAYPYKDSFSFIKKLHQRLAESGCMDTVLHHTDSLQLAEAIKKFQKKKQLKINGKITSLIISQLNNTDAERFKKIAINLDRYKQLPDKLPQKYIWVNLPGYYLQVWDNDSIIFESKVIVGKPTTRTPLLNSQITDMITYPQWTIPNSIIKKDILPAMKRNAGYLARKGFHLVNEKGENIDPYSVDWQKYSKGIPYKIVQGSGDDNALGIFKFNFYNPYNVYLHDTNQRYLFKNEMRALSHGCVRVKDWEQLAYIIAANDSTLESANKQISYNADSIKMWINNKVRKRIIVKNKFPVYIRYFTCQGKNGKIFFYDDVYGEDKILKERYFANK